MKRNMNIENLIVQVIKRNETKKRQLEKVADISCHLTSDAGIRIEAELYEGNICRFLITGTRCGMTITFDTHTLEIKRKPRGKKPVFTTWESSNAFDILRMAEGREQK